MLEPYTLDYFKIVNRDELSQAYILQKEIIKRFNPKSVVDFGAATGLYLTQFTCPKKGIDNSEVAFDDQVRMVDKDILVKGDLTKILDLEPYDLGLCIEVLEHIEEKYAEQFIENMVNCSNTWVVTAAQPGQAGLNHVSCHPQKYWESKFQVFGFYRDSVDEINLIYPISLVPHQFWIIRNLMVFKKLQSC